MKPLSIILQITPADPNANTKAIIFWIVVVLCVGLFFYFLKRTDRIINQEAALELKKSNDTNKKASFDEISDETAAAIALAIHQYKNDLHDKESLRITLQKVSRIYSPWSSKIYGIRQNPRG
ncbi:MAG: hypothetical protein M0P66_13990 [Salinivirgaceae bacterium]|nr:hypothetical protein [Salinivirgaceae bacterium]